MAKDKRRKTVRITPRADKCSFCEDKKTPSWKDSELLKTFLTNRGRIMGKSFTGLCAKHQRVLAKAIKHARHLALLPFTTGM
jgi:small subunit ribosomal protein S18